MQYTYPADPPLSVLEFFRRKGWKIGFDYRDVWKEEHLAAFTVAKGMDLDILADIRDAVDSAIADGTSYEKFASRLEPILQEKGWWGFKEMIDPLTVEKKMVELGTPRRLAIIFQTNLRTSYKYGQYQRIERTKDAFPYLLRTLGPSKEHRPEHVSWNGTVLPVDDPWWKEHYPPDAWGCKCRIRQISKQELTRLERSGVPSGTQEIDPRTGLPTGRRSGERTPIKTTAPPTEYVDWKNIRTGLTERVPKGVDPGWNFDMGKVARADLAKSQMRDKAKQFPENWQSILLRFLSEWIFKAV